MSARAVCCRLLVVITSRQDTAMSSWKEVGVRVGLRWVASCDALSFCVGAVSLLVIAMFECVVSGKLTTAA